LICNKKIQPLCDLYKAIKDPEIKKAAHRRPFEQQYDFQLEV
jgi:hypothetical protein